MSIISALLLLIVGFLAVAFTLVTIRFNMRRRKAAKAAAAATREQLDQIYSLLEAAGGEPPAGGILVADSETSLGTESVISIPGHVLDFPWAGRAFEVHAAEKVEILPCSHLVTKTQLFGRTFRYVGVPRERTKSGKVRNMFDPNRCLRASPDLKAAVERIYPDNSAELLSYLLCDGRIEFDPIDQARVGTSPAWVQSPELRSCGKCKKRMVLVLQIPGSLLHQKRFREGTFFLFGCRNHPDELVTVGQYS